MPKGGWNVDLSEKLSAGETLGYLTVVAGGLCLAVYSEYGGRPWLIAAVLLGVVGLRLAATAKRRARKGTVAARSRQVAVAKQEREALRRTTDALWTDTLTAFDEATRRALQFLVDEKEYSDPLVQFARDYSLVYEQKDNGTKISVCLERDFFVPFMFIDLATPTGRVAADAVGILLSTADIPSEAVELHKLLRKESVLKRLQRDLTPQTIREQYFRLLECLGHTFRRNYESTIGKVESEGTPQ